MEPAFGRAHPVGRGDETLAATRPPAILYRPIGSSALDGVSALRSVVRVVDADGRPLLDDDATPVVADPDLLDRETLLDAGRRLGEWAEVCDGLVVWAQVGAAAGLERLEETVESALRAGGRRRHRLGLSVPASVLLEENEAERARELRAAGVAVLARGIGAEGAVEVDPADVSADVVHLHADLVRRVADDEAARARLGDLLGRCARAGIPTIAAGVDELSVLAHLEALGVDQVEGALAGQPEQALVIGMLLTQVGVRAPDLQR